MAEMFKVNAPVRKPLFEGVQGENEARSIVFDITPWVEELGDGAVTATAKRSQDSQPYPVTVTKDGTTVTWKPTSTDTAFAGVGSFQLEYTVDSVLAKTCIWSTMVAPSLDPAGDPPDPYDNWLAEMRQIAADAIQAAQDADESADDAQAEVYEAEAWAKGTKNGTPVPSTADQYQNNAKYWAEQSHANQYGAYIVKSASGDIASFNDGADDVPMKSLNVTITPKQSGSGDPSPSNVRPITGTSTANITVEGVNLWDEVTEDGAWDNGTGEPLASPTNLRNKNPIAVDPNTQYYMNKVLFRYYYDASMNFISYDPSGSNLFTTPANAKYMNIRQGKSSWDGTNTAINYPSTDTAYVPYAGHTTPVPLGQTVYGGEVNPSTGELKITHAYKTFGQLSWYLQSGDNTGNLFYAPILDAVDLNPTGHIGWCDKYACYVKGEETGWWYRNMGDLKFIYSVSGISNQKRIYVRDNSYTDASSFASANANTQLVYELATPTTVQLTPAQVASLLGTNNVWADCGAVEVEYRADPTLAYNELANVIVSLGGNL